MYNFRPSASEYSSVFICWFVVDNPRPLCAMTVARIVNSKIDFVILSTLLLISCLGWGNIDEHVNGSLLCRKNQLMGNDLWKSQTLRRWYLSRRLRIPFKSVPNASVNAAKLINIQHFQRGQLLSHGEPRRFILLLWKAFSAHKWRTRVSRKKKLSKITNHQDWSRGVFLKEKLPWRIHKETERGELWEVKNSIKTVL